MQIRLKHIEGYQYVGLFGVLVGVMFIHPYLPSGGEYLSDRVNHLILGGLVALIPAMAIIALVEHRGMMIIAVALGIPATASLLNEGLGDPLGGGILTRVAPLAFYLFATAVICYHVVSERRVQIDTLFGAICGYLMLGYTWSWAYGTLIYAEPDSFASTYQLDDGGTGLFYFSFVTLTTLGYGDVVPLTAQARSLAMMESITGVLYLAVLVSRLVAMYGSTERERSLRQALADERDKRS